MDELKIFTPNIFKDTRGFFFEAFNQKIFTDRIKFVQDNISLSHKNVLRGLHFQIDPMEQGKFVRVLRGSIFDVAVDLRKRSPSYGVYKSFILDDINNNALWIPPGFAHGFLSTSAETIIQYKTTNFYSPKHERTIAWNDPDIGIDWPISNILDLIISDKDKQGIFLKNFE